MHKLMTRLHSDHRNLNQLFNMLDDQVARYQFDSRQDPDLPLIIDIIAYLNDYPKAYHHPLEEKAIGLMAERELGDAAVNEFIHSQHRDLEEATERLSILFNMAANDQPVSIDRIHEALEAYLTLSRKHLQAEDDRLFPVMERVLGNEEWEVIASRLPERRDPLFTGDPDKVFEDLRKRL